MSILAIMIIAMVIITVAFYYSDNMTEMIVFMLITAMAIGIVLWSTNVALENNKEKRISSEIEYQRKLAIEVFGTDNGFNENWKPQWAR